MKDRRYPHPAWSVALAVVVTVGMGQYLLNRSRYGAGLQTQYPAVHGPTEDAVARPWAREAGLPPLPRGLSAIHLHWLPPQIAFGEIRTVGFEVEQAIWSRQAHRALDGEPFYVVDVFGNRTRRNPQARLGGASEPLRQVLVHGRRWQQFNSSRRPAEEGPPEDAPRLRQQFARWATVDADDPLAVRWSPRPVYLRNARDEGRVFSFAVFASEREARSARVVARR